MAYLIKSLGSAEKPYSSARHLKENHSVIGFPGRSANVHPGDTLFLYAVGSGKFFGIVTMLGWQDDCFDDEYYGLRANVFINVKIFDLDNAPDSTRIFPLPSGKDATSLRQHSHIFIESEDAKLLTKKIIQAVKKEIN